MYRVRGVRWSHGYRFNPVKQPKKTMKTKTRNGLTLEWACDSRGASMGRGIRLPSPGETVRLHLVRVPLDSGGYDFAGAYWGGPANLWCAFVCHRTYSPVRRRFENHPPHIALFVRAPYRGNAKQAVRREFAALNLSEPKFYR